MEIDVPSQKTARPLCPVFGLCGGCSYQDLDYPDELKVKREQLMQLFSGQGGVSSERVLPVVASPKPYFYRNRLDLKLKRFKDRGIEIGFSPVHSRGVVSVDACSIADLKISDFIPELKREAVKVLPAKYRMANLVIRTGEDGKVFWGGIGRGSCHLPEQNYFWTSLLGRKIFYSLDTFFQANLSILPLLFDFIRSLDLWKPRPVFYDLYGGVGLFSIGLADLVQKAVLIEENPMSVDLARHNVLYNDLSNCQVIDGKVEEEFVRIMGRDAGAERVAMIDPPRAGLSAQACRLLSGSESLGALLYLSCNPETLARDLKIFCANGWAVQTVAPFDFFPKTKHLEVLVVLRHKSR